MLSRDNQQQTPSPFSMEGLGQPIRQQHQQQPVPAAIPERNKGRGFRRSGNACEVAAGASLNSAIIFLFHLLQVHPLGLVVALGVSHFYFLGTAFGEGRDRLLANCMTGASAGVASISALNEPIGEWIEARQSESAAEEQLQAWYSPQSSLIIGGHSALILFGVAGIALVAIGSQGKQNSNRRRS
ncbi:MAG TPA: hypothetical protein V6C84_30905 [Coleofasciculaceae cyanobacterium]